jgi:type VI protein secretion system component Hcp
MPTKLITGLFAAALFTLSASSAAAQTTDTFMLVPGIPGDSTSDRHANWIVVYSVVQNFDSGLRNPGSCTVAVAKGLDRSGPPLWAAAVTGTTFPQITIEITKASGTPVRFYDLILTDAKVTTISSSPSVLAEQLTIAGTKATLKYYPQNPDGSIGSPISATVDCSATSSPVTLRK